jgi:arylsulfatase A-like enzyme
MMHVPLIVKRPGNHRENKIDTRNCTLMDIAPTILASLDMDIPEFMEGKNLLDNSESLYPLVFMETYKGAVKGQRSVKFQLKVKPLSYAVVQGNAKLIYTPKSRKYEAYNLQRDPFENINLYYKSKNNFVELQETLRQHMATVKKFIQEGLKKYKQKSQLSKEDQENLKTLGYL